MSNRWIDVNVGDWFYNDVEEISNHRVRILKPDGTFVNAPLYAGPTYTEFEPDHPYIYEEFQGDGVNVAFTINKKIVPTDESPLLAYMDGRRAAVKSIENADASGNPSNSHTTVTLHYPPSVGSVVSIVGYGVPLMENGRPVDWGGYYPKCSIPLPAGATYTYVTYKADAMEYAYAFGRQLRRALLPYDALYIRTVDEALAEYIGNSQDMYWIDKWTNTLYTSYALNGVTVTLTYSYMTSTGLKTETVKVKPTSSRTVHNDRFFPNLAATRTEVYTVLGRLLEDIYHRYTDFKFPRKGSFDHTYTAYVGQQVFRTPSAVYTSYGDITVKVTEGGITRTLAGYEYDITDPYTIQLSKPTKRNTLVQIIFTKTESTRFSDISPDNTDYWSPYVLALEDAQISTGEYVVDESVVTPGAFAADDKEIMHRATVVALLNRFRKYCLERFA